MKRICSIYKSPRKNEMYLYVLKAEALTRVPEGLLAVFGPPAGAGEPGSAGTRGKAPGTVSRRSH